MKETVSTRTQYKDKLQKDADKKKWTISKFLSELINNFYKIK